MHDIDAAVPTTDNRGRKYWHAPTTLSNPAAVNAIAAPVMSFNPTKLVPSKLPSITTVAPPNVPFAWNVDIGKPIMGTGVPVLSVVVNFQIVLITDLSVDISERVGFAILTHRNNF